MILKKKKNTFILNMNYIENYIEMQQMRNSVFQLVCKWDAGEESNKFKYKSFRSLWF